MPSQSVLVIGGGLAGLASAVALAEAGFEIRLLEKRPHLGGRATSYTLPDGSEVDNCQHVTLGCCTNLADFYRRAGADGQIQFYDRLYFADRQGRRSVMEASSLPAPLHMAFSFARFQALTFADKRSIARALLAIARAGGRPKDIESISMLDWLRRMRQTTGAIDRFWRTVLVSALDEDLEKTEARYGIDVFWKGFLANSGGYRIGIPSVPLAALYEGCRHAVEKQGGVVRLRSGIRQIQFKGGEFLGVILEDSSEMKADACIVAVPHNVITNLLPTQAVGLSQSLRDLHNIHTSPITGVHLWFDRPVMDEPFLALLDHRTQWIFNKTRLYAKQGSEHAGNDGRQSAAFPGQYLQLVISASYDFVPMSRQEIIDLCLKEVADVLPAVRGAKLEKATVIKEVSATFSPEPGVDRFRPPQDVGAKGLFFAGDWTQTGWPSTMEGAVRSGYLAAEAVTASFGRPQKFIQPDLPAEGLSAWWARRTATNR